MKKTNAKPARYKTTPSTQHLEATEYKGNLLIHDLWQNGTKSVYNMPVLNTYVKSHSAKTPEKCRQEVERAKKKMYLEACLQQCRHFSPSVTVVYGILDVEVVATLKRI